MGQAWTTLKVLARALASALVRSGLRSCLYQSDEVKGIDPRSAPLTGQQ